MRHFVRVLITVLGLCLPATAFAQAGPPPAAPPSPQGAVHAVSYVESVPGSERMAIALLKRYRDESRRETGSLRIDILQQVGKPGHFIVLETWQDNPSWTAHGMSAHTQQLATELTAQLASPVDQRTYSTLAIAVGSAGDDSLYVVTHVDTIGGGQNDPAGLLRQLADDSRKDDGNQRFDIVQGERRNHFTVVEAWRNQRALDAHAAAMHTKAYRERLQPMAGSPIDERVLTVVK